MDAKQEMEQLTRELEHDLVLLARMQYDFNLRNEKAILIRFKESRKLLEYGIDVKQDPTRLKEFFMVCIRTTWTRRISPISLSSMAAWC